MFEYECVLSNVNERLLYTAISSPYSDLGIILVFKETASFPKNWGLDSPKTESEGKKERCKE